MSGKNSLTVDDKMATVKFKINKDAHITIDKEHCKTVRPVPAWLSVQRRTINGMINRRR